jgi:hypothetical protein
VSLLDLLSGLSFSVGAARLPELTIPDGTCRILLLSSSHHDGLYVYDFVVADLARQQHLESLLLSWR